MSQTMNRRPHETLPPGLGDGPRDPRLSALSTAVASLVSDYELSPAIARSWRLDESRVVAALDDFTTPAEQALVERGDARLVRRLRSAFGKAITGEHLSAEGVHGRKVSGLRREINCPSSLCLEIFLLANEGRLPSEQPRRARVPDPERTPR